MKNIAGNYVIDRLSTVEQSKNTVGRRMYLLNTALIIGGSVFKTRLIRGGTSKLMFEQI